MRSAQQLFDDSFPAGKFLPHGNSYLWKPGIVWLHVLSDSIIALSYYAIPLSLIWYVRRRQDLDFRWVYLCFAAFIFACGTTHLLEIWNVWHADYELSGVVKALTAAISLPVAYLLHRLVPKAAVAPNPGTLRKLNEELAAEISTRKNAEEKMRELTAQLERRVAERTTELQLINTELQKSEEMFSKAFRVSPDCLAIVRLSDRTVIRANEAVCRLWGSPPEEVIGRPTKEYTNWLSDEERLSFMRTLQEKGECLNYETDLRLNDGRLVRFNISSRMITLGDESCVLSVMSDISARKKAEITAAQLAAIVESSADAIIGKNLLDMVTSWNAGAEKIMGYSAEEVIGQSIYRFIPPDRHHEEDEIMARLNAGETVQSLETIRLKKNGTQIAVSVTVSPIRDVNGRMIGASKILRDISAQKQAEAAQRASEIRYRTLFEYAPDGILIADTESRYLDANASICRMLGYSRYELIGLQASDIVSVTEVGQVAPALDIIKSRSTYHREWEFRRKNGTRFGAEVIATMMPDGNLMGMVRDITERKNAELVLREKEQLLHSADRRLAEIMHGMTEACFALDEQWCFTFVNDRTEGLLHIRREEILGRSIWEVFGQLVGTPVEKHYRHAMSKRVPVAFEVLSVIACRWLDIRLFPTGEGLAAFLLDVHARKLSEEALRESEARYRGTLDRMMEGCQIIGRDWRYLYINEIAARHGRRRVEDLVGKTIMECYPGIEATPVFATIERCMREQRSEQMENTFSYPDGVEASFQLGIQSVPEGVFILSLDITERKKAEAALQHSRQEFKDLFDNAPVGYHEVNREGRLCRVNQAELKMLGYSEQELLGKFVWDIAVDQQLSREAVQAKLAGTPPPAAFERLFRRKDGSVFPVLIEDRLVKRSDGVVTAIQAIVQDITERKKAEEDIRRLNGELESRVVERTAQLEAANKELEAFSYSISHDLRAPLRAVDGFSQAVLEDFGPTLPPEGIHQLQTVRQSAQRMGELIDDLLTFSRLSRQKLRKQRVDTSKMVRSILDELLHEAGVRKIEIKLTELSVCMGDPALLRQVWINVLSNAFKYTLKREQAVIEIGSCVREGEMVYFVCDNGTGFDMRYAHKLFGVFQRLHRAEDYEGTGVGLAIVQRIVQRHGGKVWAEAKLDEGATFYFTLGEELKP